MAKSTSPAKPTKTSTRSTPRPAPSKAAKAAKVATRSGSARAKATEPPKRARLDHEQVVHAAEVLVDEHGWDHLSMAGLAAALGVKVPSLYNHIEGLDGLRGELQVRTMERLGRAFAAEAMGRTGPEGLVAMARVHRAFAREHPHLYQGAMREPHDREAFFKASAQANEALLAVLRSYDMEHAAALETELAMFSCLHGFVVLESAGFFTDLIDVDVLFGLVLGAALRMVEG